MYSEFEQIFKDIFIKKKMEEQVLKCKTCFDFNDKSLKRECRKILDKVAIGLIYNEFENEKYIDAMLKLARVERIIIALNIVAQIDLQEIAFYLIRV